MLWPMLLHAYRTLTCDALPTPRWLSSLARGAIDGPDAWRAMEAALERAGQAHVLTPEPPPEKRSAFLAQLRAIDLEGLPKLLQNSLAHAAEQAASKRLEPFPHVQELDDLPADEVAVMREQGLQMIARGEVAALLLAGGQGTRLGTSAPKGCYDIGLLSSKSIFQYHAERILKVRRLAASHAGVDEESVRLPFLVMTSHATDRETRSFFAAHHFFGLQPDDVLFFEQGMLPCLTPDGKLLLDAPGELSMAPNGNGGVYMSLRDAGLLTRLEEAGVTSVFQFGVDNVLCHVADPTFLGFCSLRNADCAAKTVPKRDPHEPVGVLALAGGQPAVVEYSEITTEMAEARDDRGRLLFGAAHICVNFFSVPFLRHFCDQQLHSLPLHVAKKKIPYAAARPSTPTPQLAPRAAPQPPTQTQRELTIRVTIRAAAQALTLSPTPNTIRVAMQAAAQARGGGRNPHPSPHPHPGT